MNSRVWREPTIANVGRVQTCYTCMDIKSTLVIGGFAFFGCLIGSYAAFQVVPAQAQVGTTTPPTIQEQLFVPRDGLKMQTEDGRVIGMIGHRMGNGFLVLLDSSGRVGVEISAGPGGSASITPIEGGMALLMGGNDPAHRASLQVTGSQAQLELGQGSSSVNLSSGSDAASLRLFHSNDRLGTFLGATREGGRVTSYDGAGNIAFDMVRDRNGNRFIVNGDAGLPAVSLLGSGGVTIMRDGEQIWGAPPARTDGDRNGN